MTRQRIDNTLRSVAETLNRALSGAAGSVISLLRIATAGVPVRPRFPDGLASRVLILGSGPSLADSLRTVSVERIGNLDLLCVNDFYKEESFTRLRPRMLAIADPAYWDERCFDEYGGPLIAALKRVDWKLTLFLPARAKGSKLHRELSTSGVQFELFATTPVSGYGWFEELMFAAKLGMPRPQNVLVAAIALAIWAGFKEVGIVGADHSWHQEIFVDTDNMLITAPQHNYQSQTRRRPFVKPHAFWKFRAGQVLERDDTFSMREILLAWAAMHSSYEDLATLAVRRRVRVLNCSAISFIDAFEREPLARFAGSSAAEPGAAA